MIRNLKLIWSRTERGLSLSFESLNPRTNQWEKWERFTYTDKRAEAIKEAIAYFGSALSKEELCKLAMV